MVALPRLQLWVLVVGVHLGDWLWSTAGAACCSGRGGSGFSGQGGVRVWGLRQGILGERVVCGVVYGVWMVRGRGALSVGG